jgi:hypothetical protein
MATLLMDGQAPLSSQLMQAPHLRPGVQGDVWSFAQHAVLSEPVYHSPGEQVPHRAPHERLVSLVAPHFLRCFGPHHRSPVSSRDRISPSWFVVQSPK